MPKVSVVIPAYNCERFISDAIESILRQSYKDYEIVIVDDGSTDKTAEIIKQYNNEKIKYIYQTNGGPAKARNTGIFNSKGEYIAFLDQDDAWLTNKLKLQVEVLENNNRVGLVYTDIYIVRDDVFNNSTLKFRRSFQIRPPQRGKVLKDLFLENFIPTSSVMVHRECFEKIGMFDLSLPPIEDYDRWLRISAQYDIDYIDKPLVKYRDHVACFRKNEVLTVTNTINTLNGILSDYHILKKLLGERINERLSRLYIILGKIYLSKGTFKKAFYNFSLSFKLKKSWLIPLYILFSYFFDRLMEVLRYIKFKIRKFVL